MVVIYKNLINLKNASLAKKAFCDLSINNYTKNILDLLLAKGFISFYFYINKFTVRVVLKYYLDSGLLDNLKPMYSKDVSYSNLCKLRFINESTCSFICISTSKGTYFLLDFFTLNYKCGGKLLFKLS